ncbi:MAG: UDP-N-acetylmuramoyl-tripeptide--D-alanyl-D-alanine ligase [Armatimonadota bacterium]
MSELTVQDVADTCGGRIVHGGAGTRLAGIATDTRALRPGELFVALPGERYDGHDFLVDAAKSGALAIVGARDVRDELPNGVAVILVEDTVRALGALAAAHRRRHDVPLVAVTGSTGKTTTKEMLRHALQQTCPPVLASEGTENNEIGVPLTLLRLDAEHRAVTLEFAMRGRGEIAYLTKVASPTVGVVTNVGSSHVGRLGSLAEVAAAKAELVSGLGREGTAVLNADDALVAGMRDVAPGPVLTFGLDSAADVTARDLRSEGWSGTTFLLQTRDEEQEVSLRLPGRHNVSNALAAAAAALAVSASLQDIAAALELFECLPGRGRLIRSPGGFTIIDDTYNASPASVRAALAVIREAPSTGRTIVALGDMLELGDSAPEAHRRAGADMAAHGIDLVLSVGEYAPEVVEGVTAAGGGTVAHGFAGKEALLARLRAELRPDDTVLVKGSRAVGMEEIVRGLLGD